MLRCPRCQQDELTVVEFPSVGLLCALCPECDALWPKGVPIRTGSRDELYRVLDDNGLSWEDAVEVVDIAKGEWLVDAYRESGYFVTRCSDCEQVGVELKRIIPTGRLLRVCPHCTQVWFEDPAPMQGALAGFLRRNGLTEDDLE